MLPFLVIFYSYLGIPAYVVWVFQWIDSDVFGKGNKCESVCSCGNVLTLCVATTSHQTGNNKKTEEEKEKAKEKEKGGGGEREKKYIRKYEKRFWVCVKRTSSPRKKVEY